MTEKRKTERHNALKVSAAKLKGEPGHPVPERIERWRSKQIEICRFILNGDPVEVATPVHWTLLEILRYKLGYTGTKQGCDKGDCGSCTVRVNGEAMLSCIIPSMQAMGMNIQTVESLGHASHPLVEAFEEHGAAQCGFCIPGMLMSAMTYIEEEQRKTVPMVTRDGIARALSGNLCRCTGYTKILQAVEKAWEKMESRSDE